MSHPRHMITLPEEVGPSPKSHNYRDTLAKPRQDWNQPDATGRAVSVTFTRPYDKQTQQTVSLSGPFRKYLRESYEVRPRGTRRQGSPRAAVPRKPAAGNTVPFSGPSAFFGRWWSYIAASRQSKTRYHSSSFGGGFGPRFTGGILKRTTKGRERSAPRWPRTPGPTAADRRRCTTTA